MVAQIAPINEADLPRVVGLHITALMETARQRGYRQITGRYIATPKNALVADLYPRLGFQILQDDARTGQRYVIDTTTRPAWKTFIRSA